VNDWSIVKLRLHHAIEIEAVVHEHQGSEHEWREIVDLRRPLNDVRLLEYLVV